MVRNVLYIIGRALLVVASVPAVVAMILAIVIYLVALLLSPPTLVWPRQKFLEMKDDNDEQNTKETAVGA